MKIPEYIVGLDIGTDSCGYVATDFKNNLLHVHGKTAIGARLFIDRQHVANRNPAANRRGFRTTRRRLKRRKWRLGLLQEIFETDSDILKDDQYFFARMKESGLSSKDTRKQYHSIIFKNKKQETDFYNNYPTIYHLRNKLMTEDKQFSLTEIFIALHHIVKYRGNFLKAGESIENYKARQIDVKDVIEKLQTQFEALNIEIQFNIDKANEVQNILVDSEKYKSDKQKEIKKLLVTKIADKQQNKTNEAIAAEITNAILGYKTKFEKIFAVTDIQDKTNWEFKLTDSDVDSKIEKLFENLSAEQQEVFITINELYSAVMLNEIVPSGMTLSQSMIQKYDEHKNDLKLLKTVISSIDTEKGKKLQESYDHYVNNRHASSKNLKSIDKDEFYKQIKTVLKNIDSNEAKTILVRVEQDSFMPKQRTNRNGVIPYQIHQIELDKIIENQGEYYPFLKQENPIESHRKQAPYKLDELLRFRVPYYVGPMVTSKVQKQTSGADFAWMIRKENGRITPWNFEDKVDKDASATKFIKRMTTKDTYLFAEDVLPVASLLYQKFTVLNELNNIKINGHKLEPSQKMNIYEDLFKNGKTVTVSTKTLKNYWRQNYTTEISKIDGMVDKIHFISKLESYHFLKNILGSIVDEQDKKKDLEQILEYSTVFEDAEIYQRKLKNISWLTPEQIKKLVKKHYKGWGRLSKKLLTKITDQNGQNIIQLLEDTTSNFQQIVNKPEFQEKIAQTNAEIIKDNKSDVVEDILGDAYTSPANKKAIRQVMKVVDDIVKACHHQAPKQIAIEFAREPDSKMQGKLTKSKYRKLQNLYKTIANELSNSKELSAQLENSKDSISKDKYYLYFTQAGRDVYTGKPIPIDQIHNYEIDHILPQSFIKDDSMSNRVLVAKAVNNSKSDNVPLKLYGQNIVPGQNITIKQLWKEWKDLGLITNRKYNNLCTDPDHIDKFQKMGFINRQLVETSQIIKLVATILQSKYPDTEIIVVKASANHKLREQFDLYKSREVNDYHHAIDAYLTTIVGNYLYQVYPKLRRLFVYGQYQRFNSDAETNKKIYQNARVHDFLGALLNSKNDEIKDTFGNVKFNREDIINKLKRAYAFKYMNISRETYIASGALYDQTIYSPKEKKPESLIQKKKDLPTEIYGGYTSKQIAYMSLVKIKNTYKVVNVPVLAIAEIKKLSKNNYNDEFKEILFRENTSLKDKKFKILIKKIPKEQVVKVGKKRFSIVSATESHNIMQMVLSEQAMRTVTDHFLPTDNQMDMLTNAYDEILDKIDKYLPLYKNKAGYKNLLAAKEQFLQLSVEERKQKLKQILSDIHDTKGDFRSRSIPLNKDAVLVYKSPTGLFEKRVKISEL